MDELPPLPPQKHLDLHTPATIPDPPMQTTVCVRVYAMLLFYLYVLAFYNLNICPLDVPRADH